MQWNSVSEFLNMGGYALYVWGSFGVTGAAMLIESLLIRTARKSLLGSIRCQQADEEGLR